MSDDEAPPEIRGAIDTLDKARDRLVAERDERESEPGWWSQNWWKFLLIVGVFVNILITQVTLDGHTGQLNELQTAVTTQSNSHHNETYPVIVAICEHTPGCPEAVHLTTPKKK